MSILQNREQAYQKTKEIDNHIQFLCSILSKLGLEENAENVDELHEALENNDYVSFLLSRKLSIVQENFDMFTLTPYHVYPFLFHHKITPFKGNIESIHGMTRKRT